MVDNTIDNMGNNINNNITDDMDKTIDAINTVKCIGIMKLSENAIIPTKAYEYDAGYDLYST